MRWSERVYRSLLCLYPREFRDEYADEMSLLFRERTADGLRRLWLQGLGDLAFHAPKEHWSTMKQDQGTLPGCLDRHGDAAVDENCAAARDKRLKRLTSDGLHTAVA